MRGFTKVIEMGMDTKHPGSPSLYDRKALLNRRKTDKHIRTHDIQERQ
jgi:hypothetical protein